MPSLRQSVDTAGAGFVLLCATNSLAERPSVTACFAHWQVAGGRAYHIPLFRRLQTMMKLQVLKR